MRTRRITWRHMLPAMAGALLAAASTGPVAAQAPTPWPFFGSDFENTRANLSHGISVNAPTQINPRNAARLALRWSFSTIGDVSATPTVEASGLYVPDYAGWLYKLDPATGAQIWAHSLSDYVGSYASSRNSPAIGAQGEIVLGLQTTFAGVTPGARVIAIDRTTGLLRWQTIVDVNPNSFVTTSPVIYNKRVYLGVASSEEVLVSANPSFTPTFRGSVVALDEATGAIVWTFKTVPDGYSGGSVWGSSPVVWRAGKSLIVGTGNNFSLPAAASNCLQTLPQGSGLRDQVACLDPSDYADSLLSLDLATGRLNWGRRFEVDAWTSGCSVGPASACPTPAGLDHDFASAPNMVYVDRFVGVADDSAGTSRNYLLGAGQKSGYYYLINPYNGGLFNSIFLGQGEILWGSAINMDDRNAAYVALYNRGHYTNTLAGKKGVPVTWNAGAWASVALPSGTINWQIPATGTDVANPQFGGASPGPVTFANYLVFAGSTSGLFTAIDSSTGNVRWTYNAGGPIIGGPSFYNETIYWGAGAQRSGPGAVHTVFAFWVPPLL